jgi:hypothetical protein
MMSKEFQSKTEDEGEGAHMGSFEVHALPIKTNTEKEIVGGLSTVCPH